VKSGVCLDFVPPKRPDFSGLIAGGDDEIHLWRASGVANLSQPLLRKFEVS
jgi:hypothetical protein